MTTKKRTLAEFETTLGAPKMARLQKQLDVERHKVEALSGVQNKTKIIKSEKSLLRFAVIGDTQFGSLYSDVGNLGSFYEYLQQEGIDEVLHCGDVMDGHRCYKGQEFEVEDLGFEAQLKRLEKSAPRIPGMITRFITGNHDATFKSLAGISVGQSIEAARPDWVDHGEEQATIKYDTPNGEFSVKLMHPGGGTAYALSYKIQKIAEQLEGGTKPNMLAIGHYHKAEFIPSYRNIALVQSGCFQRQTPFMARQGLSAHVGGWIFEVNVGKGYNVIKGEFVAFYS